MAVILIMLAFVIAVNCLIISRYITQWQKEMNRLRIEVKDRNEKLDEYRHDTDEKLELIECEISHKLSNLEEELLEYEYKNYKKNTGSNNNSSRNTGNKQRGESKCSS